VCLFNPRSVLQKLASGIVSGIPGQHKFHFSKIPERWFKVDVRESHCPTATLMFPMEDAEQTTVKDIVNGNTLWDGKFMKSAT
jgi:hypothetical protein